MAVSLNSPFVYAQNSEKTIDKEDKELAKIHFDKGQKEFSAGEFLKAVEHFKIAYDLTDSPEILYNIARCYEEADETDMAIIEYQAYLKITTANDQAEVESRIQWLEDNKAADKPEVEEKKNLDENDDGYLSDPIPEDDKKVAKKKLDAFELELRLGPSFVILNQKGDVQIDRHHYFSVDILGHFFIREWFAITGVLAFAGYMEGNLPIDGRDAQSQAGGGIGITMHKLLSKKALLATGILAIPTSIKRADVSKRAVFIDFQFSVGIHILLPKDWSVTTSIVADLGPSFVVQPDLNDWNPSLFLTTGARVGMAYTF
ncbi:MAG: tetratricopeptide repeat protein [Deltaproteobacteria bacterium]|nr:tetratricopeptide repeat protein [Deltaproteobacteria bacterium]